MIDQLRLLNLLQGLSPSTGPYSPDNSVGPQMVDFQDNQQMPSNEAEMQLRAMLGQMPQRNTPGVGRRIMAAMVGLGGGNTDAVNYAPYNRQMQDWNAKLKPLSELASVERASNTNERLRMSSEKTAKLNRDRLDLAEKTADEKATAAAEDRKIRQQRANTEQYRADHPNAVFKETDSGEIIAIDPVSKKATPILDAEGQPIKSINLTPEQKKAMEVTKQAGRIEAIQETGKQARETKQTAPGFNQKLEEFRQAGRIDLKKTPSGNFTATAGKALQPSQQRIDRINKLMQIVSDYPELEPYYEMDDDGNIKVIEGKDPDMRQIALTKLYSLDRTTGSDIPLDSPKPKSVTTKPSIRADGKTHVRRNGQDGWVTKPLPTDELIP